MQVDANKKYSATLPGRERESEGEGEGGGGRRGFRWGEGEGGGGGGRRKEEEGGESGQSPGLDTASASAEVIKTDVQSKGRHSLGHT